jgi:hypothetical protein
MSSSYQELFEKLILVNKGFLLCKSQKITERVPKVSENQLLSVI